MPEKIEVGDHVVLLHRLLVGRVATVVEVRTDMSLGPLYYMQLDSGGPEGPLLRSEIALAGEDSRA